MREQRRCWLIDGNNTFGSRPDGWWNDRPAAMERFTQAVGEWCRTHRDEVIVVFDPPVPDGVAALAGGNLTVIEARRRGRDAADDMIVELIIDRVAADLVVVTSDKGLRARLPSQVEVRGVGAFRDAIGY